MLEKLEIENFKRHETFTLEFDENVTVLVGRNDAGKSSVLGALRWLTENKPRGTGFIRHGCKQTKVTLGLDGKTVIRERTETKNSYQLEGDLFEAFANGIPETIETTLRIHPYSFQGQLDGVFWFSLSPGQISKELNTIVHLDLIDSSLSYLSSKQRKAKVNVELSETNIDQLSKRKKELKWVLEADKELAMIETLENRISKKANELTKINEIVETIVKTTVEIKGIVNEIALLTPIVNNMAFLFEVLEKKQKLMETLQQIKESKQKINKFQIEIENERKELEEQLQGKCPVCGSENTVSI